MKKLKSRIKDYFVLTEKEANGFIILSVIMILIIIFPIGYDYYLERSGEESSVQSIPVLTELEASHHYSNSSDNSLSDSAQGLSPFNPNIINAENWENLGLSSTIAHRIEKYKAKGGQFKTKSDLLKIYGFPKDLYYSLHSFILLPDSTEKKKRTTSLPEQAKKAAPFDINKATKGQLELVHGVGPVLADRILKFRDKLGGFVRKEQLYEVYGLDEKVALKLIEASMISADFRPRTLSLNAASYDDLISHPYIGKKEAAIILEYKEEHGEFKSEKDLNEGLPFPAEKRAKIKPYIVY